MTDLHRVNCCSFHGINCRQGRDCPARDVPMESPETTAFRLEVAIVAIACTFAASLVN